MDIIPKIFEYDQALKRSDFVNDTMKLALLSGTFDECNLRYTDSFNDLSAYEIAPIYGYPAGGMPVYGKSVENPDKQIYIKYDIDNTGFTVSGGQLGPIRYGVIYNESNSNHLVYIFDFGEDKTVNDGADFQIKIDDNGLMWAEQNTPTNPIEQDTSCNR